MICLLFYIEWFSLNLIHIFVNGCTKVSVHTYIIYDSLIRPLKHISIMATNKPTEDTTRTTEGEEKIEIDTILSFIGISKNTPLITHLSKLYNYTLKGVSNSRILMIWMGGVKL